MSRVTGEALRLSAERDARAAETRLCPMCGRAHSVQDWDLSRYARQYQFERDMARHQVAVLRAAVRRVLDDDETGAGGWGPDVSMAAVLREAMDATEHQERVP